MLANLLTLWFFATPIIYPMSASAPELAKRVPRHQPVHAPGVSYQEILFFHGPVRALEVAARARRRLDRALFLAGYWLFDRLRDSFAEEV